MSLCLLGTKVSLATLYAGMDKIQELEIKRSLMYFSNSICGFYICKFIGII